MVSMQYFGNPGFLNSSRFGNTPYSWFALLSCSLPLRKNGCINDINMAGRCWARASHQRLAVASIGNAWPTSQKRIKLALCISSQVCDMSEMGWRKKNIPCMRLPVRQTAKLGCGFFPPSVIPQSFIGTSHRNLPWSSIHPFTNNQTLQPRRSHSLPFKAHKNGGTIYDKSYMDVSKNRGGPPKWMVHNGTPY